MPGAISGSLAAVLGHRRRVSNEIKKSVTETIKADLFAVINTHLKDLENDFVSAMNVEKKDGDLQDIMMIRLKKTTANNMIAKTRAAILKELFHKN